MGELNAGIFEIAGDQFYYQVISRTGATIDSGSVPLLLIEKSGPANALALQHNQ